MDFYRPDLERLLEVARQSTPLTLAEAQEVLARSTTVDLSLAEVAGLVRAVLSPQGGSVRSLILDAAAKLRRRLFGDRVVAMAPIEVANTCASDCVFCGWRVSNREMKRLRMSVDLIMLQVEYLIDLGITYIEFVSGDDIVAVREQLPVLVRETKRLFAERGVEGKVSFCTLALTQRQYATLREAGADSMIVWQETYSPTIFRRHVLGGPKAYGLREDWKWEPTGDGWLFRVQSQERALREGLEVALGTMIGLNPDIVFEIVATVDHARYLLNNYPITVDHPLIIGMPIWNPIPTRRSDLRPSDAPDIAGLFPVFAALYLLALPTAATWVFPNCRVPLETQVEAVRVAGVFTSTEVKLGPGGYLPAVIHSRERRGEDWGWLRRRLRELLRDAGNDLDEIARALDEREQFVHHYHAHAAYVRALAQAGLRLVRGTRLSGTPQVASA